MRFPYQGFRNPDNPKEPIIKPMIWIRLSSGNKATNVLALIDSGADMCLFHKSVADTLGIDHKLGLAKEFRGISGSQSKITAYPHLVHLTVIGLSSIDIMVGFTESDGVSALLGQSGFFDAFDITFQRSKASMDIRLRS